MITGLVLTAIALFSAMVYRIVYLKESEESWRNTSKRWERLYNEVRERTRGLEERYYVAQCSPSRSFLNAYRQRTTMPRYEAENLLMMGMNPAYETFQYQARNAIHNRLSNQMLSCSQDLIEQAVDWILQQIVVTERLTGWDIRFLPDVAHIRTGQSIREPLTAELQGATCDALVFDEICERLNISPEIFDGSEEASIPLPEGWLIEKEEAVNAS